MRIGDRFKNLFKREAATSRNGKADTVRGGAVPPWETMGDSAAVRIATVYRCVKLLSESVANLPLMFMKRSNGIFVPQSDSRLHFLLTVQPMPGVNAFDYWRDAISQILLRGNAYLVPQYDAATMDYSRIVLCAAGTVAHDTFTDTYHISDPWNGLYDDFSSDEVIHLKGMTGRDPRRGVSVLSYARTTLNIAATGDRETLDRFANGGNVRGLVSNGTVTQGFGKYQDQQLQGVAVDMDSGFRAGQRIMPVPGQVEFKPLSLTSTDMQFLESRKFTVREICRFFGVHPSFVFDDTSNNYKSAEMANVAFLSNTLNPLLRSIETELLSKLVAPTRTGKIKFQFDRRALYACDLDSRVKYQAATIAAGIYTVNDWRREENRPEVDGGDTVFVSANLRTITELTNNKNPTDKNDGEKDI